MADDDSKIKPVGGRFNFKKTPDLVRPGAKIDPTLPDPLLSTPNFPDDPVYRGDQFENEDTIHTPSINDLDEDAVRRIFGKAGQPPNYPRGWNSNRLPDPIPVIPEIPSQIARNAQANIDAMQNLLSAREEISDEDLEKLGKYRIVNTDPSPLSPEHLWFRPLTDNIAAEQAVARAIQAVPGISPTGDIDWFPDESLQTKNPDAYNLVLKKVTAREAEISAVATQAIAQRNIKESLYPKIRDRLASAVLKVDPNFDSDLIDNLAGKVAGQLSYNVSLEYTKALAEFPDNADIAARQLAKAVDGIEKRIPSYAKTLKEIIVERFGEEDFANFWQGKVAWNHYYKALEDSVNTSLVKKNGGSALLVPRTEQIVASFSDSGRLFLEKRQVYLFSENRGAERGFYGDFSGTTYVLIPNDETGYKEIAHQASVEANKEFNKEFGQTAQAKQIQGIVEALWEGNYERLVKALVSPFPNHEKEDWEKTLDQLTTTNGFTKEQKKQFKKFLTNNLLTKTGLWVRPKKWDSVVGRFGESKNAVFRPWNYAADRASRGRGVFGVFRSGVYGGVAGFAIGGPAGASVGSLIGTFFGSVAEVGIGMVADNNTERWKKAAAALKGSSGEFSFSQQFQMLTSEQFPLVFNRKKLGKKKEERNDYSSSLGLVGIIGVTVVKAAATAVARRALQIPLNQTLSDWWQAKESLSRVGGLMQNVRFGGYLASSGLKSLPVGAIGAGYGYLVSGGNPLVTLAYGGGSWFGSFSNRLLETSGSFTEMGWKIGKAHTVAMAGLKFGDPGFQRFGSLARFANWTANNSMIGINAKEGLGKFIFENEGRINALHFSYKGFLLGDVLGRLAGLPEGSLQLWGMRLGGYLTESGLHYGKGFLTAGIGRIKKWFVALKLLGRMEHLLKMPPGSLSGKLGSLKRFGIGGLMGIGLGQLIGILTGLDPNTAMWLSLATGAGGATFSWKVFPILQRFFLRLFPELGKSGIFGRIFDKLFGGIYRFFAVKELPASMEATSEAARRIPIEGLNPGNLLQLLGGALNTFWGWFTAQGILVALKNLPSAFSSFLTRSPFWDLAKLEGGMPFRTSLGLGLRAAGSSLFQAIKFSWQYARVTAGLIGTSISLFVSGVASCTAAAVSAAMAGLLGTVVAVLLLIVFTAIVVGAAIMMVTTLDNQWNPPVAKDVVASKTLTISGDNIRGVVTLKNTSTTKTYNIVTVKDSFKYILNTDSCSESPEDVKKPAHGSFYYTVKQCGVGGGGDVVCDGCEDLSGFPAGTSGNSLCADDKKLDPGESISWNFELRGFKGSSGNNPGSKGTYMNSIEAAVSEIVGAVGGQQQMAKKTATVDIGGNNACLAKYQAPCGWPVSNANRIITQECKRGNHANDVIDIGTAGGSLDNEPVLTPISGTLTRRVITTKNNGPSYAYGVWAEVRNEYYIVRFAHLKPTAADEVVANTCTSGVCDFPGKPVGEPVFVGQGSEIGRADNTGYSTGPHLHYEIIKIGTYEYLCPNNYRGGSLLDSTAYVCL